MKLPFGLNTASLTSNKYIIVTKEGVTVDPKAFSKFIMETMEGRQDHKAD